MGLSALRRGVLEGLLGIADEVHGCIEEAHRMDEGRLKVDTVRGMDIVIVTTAKTDAEAKALLTGFEMPFAN